MFKIGLSIFFIVSLGLFAGNAAGQVKAGFKASDTAGCLPVIVHFSNTSTGATSYVWDLGDGTPPFSADSASTAYTAVGSYTVTLTATGIGGTSTYSTVIRVYTVPSVSFSANDTTVCPGTPVKFTNTTVANAWGAVSYTWNFGDGGSSTLTSPTYSYDASGNYNTTLYAVNSKGCVSSLLKRFYINVFTPATVIYKASQSYYCTAPAIESFTNTSSGTGPLSYSWTFGDGSTSTLTNPTHTYSLPGNYLAKLIVTDGNGCSDSSLHHAGVQIGDLTARFTSSKSKTCIDSVVSFTDSSDVHNATWWYFGDGGTDTIDNPVHVYLSAGTFTVKHVIYNGKCYDSITHPVIISKPTGSFTVSQACPLPFNNFLFHATTSPVASITWDFGDFTTGTGSAPGHTYIDTHHDNSMGDIDSVVMTLVDSVGCITTVRKTDTSLNPFLTLQPSQEKGCAPLKIVFSAIANANIWTPSDGHVPPTQVSYPYPIVSYLWDFGDGSPTSTLASPTHIYTVPGIYHAVCHGVTSNGCAIDSSFDIPVGSSQVTTATVSPGRLCAGQPGSFVNTSPSLLVNDYYWLYGDGDNDHSAITHHIYLKPGIYNGLFKVIYNGCQSDSPFYFTDTVDAPGADIRYSYTCIPNNGMVFTDSSVGADTRLWSFGDGSPNSSLVSNTHYFPDRNNTYNVRLTTYNIASGCRDTAFFQTKFLRKPDMNIWTKDMTNVCTGQAITINSAEVNNYANILFLDTSFGVFNDYVDTSSERSFKWYDNWNPIDSTHLSVVDTFHTKGYHSISFVVVDNHGCYDTITKNNFVLVASPADSFKFTPSTGCAPLSAHFTDESTDIPGVSIVSYSWSFGDGSKDITTVPVTTHTYTSNGVFTVRGSVKDNFGCISSFTSSSNVTAVKPVASFSPGSTENCAGSSITFNNYSTGGSSWYWSFGDGTTSTRVAPSHVYTAAGLYTVSLIAYNAFGCADTVVGINPITIDPIPAASFYMDDSFAVCPPLNVHFTNTSTGGATYFWTFGDGTTSFAVNPGDIYLTPQRYTIKLTVDNLYGCIDTAIGHAVVFGDTGAFTYSPISVCGSSPVHFGAVLSNVTSIVWDFGDGSTSGLSLTDTISHAYTTHGGYLPKLILTDTSGCTSFSLGADTIRVDTMTAGFKINPNPGCVNSSIAFNDTSSSFYSSSTAWLWTFAPGFTNTSSSPSYTYSVSGSHPVTLKVTDKSGCTATVTENVTINPLPPVITGPSEICNGLSASLSDAAGAGAWYSSNTTVARIGSGTGIVSGIAAGTTTITYKVAVGCPRYELFKVDSLPAAITGGTTVCAGLTTGLSCAPAGGTWASSNPLVAAIGATSGTVSGVAAGTATITYQIPNGCVTTLTMTVGASPSLVTGPPRICTGVASLFSDAATGGAWSISNTTVATIDPSSGAVTGLAAGTATMTYSLGLGCTTSKTITVVTTPSSVTGGDSVCAGSKIPLSDPTAGGVWSSSNTSLATVTTAGVVTGVSGGPAIISYTTGATCSARLAVTVNPLPAGISGNAHICTGLTSVLSDATPGGVWSSFSAAVSVAGSAGYVTGVSAGTATITYELSTGCMITKSATVTLSPPAIKGSDAVCTGLMTILSDAVGGGTWSSSNTAVAKIGAGVVLGLSAGTATISYTVAGCPALVNVTVNPLPASITGSSHVCEGGKITLSDPDGGGTWNSLSTTVTVGAGTGVVNGLSAGTAMITYTSAAGCTTMKMVTIDPLPNTISGLPDVCVGATVTLSDAGGGTWTSSDASVASVGAGTGIVSGIKAGTATITYSLATGCKTEETVTVNPLPSAITGMQSVCAGSTIILSDASPGEIWLSGNTAVATIGGHTGIVKGISGGVSLITYVASTGCIATAVLTVNALPAAITGTGSLCVGFTTTLADLSTGGSWSSGNSAVAGIGVSSGIVTGISAGTSMITYKNGSGCMTTRLIMVTPPPSAITGVTTVCQGQTTQLSDGTTGGSWSSSNTIVATIDASGVVSGISGGTAIITYMLPTNCSATIMITVTQLNAAITGTPEVCKGLTTRLSDATVGGSWSSGNISIASVDGSGLVTGKSPGTSVITYVAVNTCGAATITVTVDPLPEAGTISGTTTICSGTQNPLVDKASGGQWSSSDPGVATVDNEGMVKAISAGKDTVSYTYTNSCGTARTSTILTINPSPEAVHIVVHPDTVLCANTLFQNFGAESPEPAGEHYIWSAANAEVYAVSANRQYCLISFPYQGSSVVKLSTAFASTNCSSTDSIKFSIGTAESPDPVVVYYTPEFVCKDNTAESYQWGYDDVVTLDSSLLAGEVNQNYYNESPDFKHRNYWVMTYHNGCLQKSYYNAPTGIEYVGNKNNIEIILFPNPADSKIGILLKGIDKTAAVDVKLYDMIGKEIKICSIVGSAGSIGLSGFPPGIYNAVFIQNGIKIGSQTFVKN